MQAADLYPQFRLFANVAFSGNLQDLQGNASIQDLNVAGNTTIARNLTAGGNTTVGSLTAGTLTAGNVTVGSLNAGNGAIQTTGTLQGGTTTVGALTATSLDAGNGAIQTTGTLQGGNTTVGALTATSLNAGSGAIETTGNLKGGSTTVTSLNAGSGAIQTTGNLKGGTTTVDALTATSLNAGNGAIQTTGTLQGGTTTVGALTATSLNAGSGAIETTGNVSAANVSAVNVSISGGLTLKELTFPTNSGTAGQILMTNGTNANWTDLWPWLSVHTYNGTPKDIPIYNVTFRLASASFGFQYANSGLVLYRDHQSSTTNKAPAANVSLNSDRIHIFDLYSIVDKTSYNIMIPTDGNADPIYMRVLTYPAA